MATEFYIGKRELISFSGTEASYGDASARLVLFGNEAKLQPKNSSNWLEIKGAGTDSVDIDAREVGVKSVGFTLEFTPQDWRFLKFVLTNGSDASIVDLGTSPTVHTFTNDKTVGSFSLERGIKHTSPVARLYTGCQVNNFSLNFDAGAGGFVKCSADVLARDVNTSTITNLSPVSTKGFKARHALVTINGVSECKCLSGNFIINNGLDAGRYACYDTDDLLKSESAVTTRRVNGSFTINVRNETYFDLWKELKKVGAKCSLKLERGTDDNVEFVFNDLYIEDAPDDTNLEGINSVTINWTAKSVSVVAKDKIVSYKI